MQKDFHYYIINALVNGNCGRRKVSMVSCHSKPDLLTDKIRPYYHQVIVVKNKPHRKHLSSSLDLVTTYEEIRANSFKKC